jgi:ubiquinone/menaquinone biosynthesis C-methylase UbiE
MHGALRRMHSSPRRTGTTIDRFRLNALVTQVAFGGRRRRVYRQIVELSGASPGHRILDVGSSSGYLARMLADAAGRSGSVTGIDPSEAAIAYARRRAPSPASASAPASAPASTSARASAPASFVAGVAQDLSAFPDDSFDVVTSTLALHHVPARQRAAAFREMYRVTRPGGRLLVADLDSSRPLLPLHPGARRMQHAAAATAPLDELAAAAGYRVEDLGALPLLRYVTAVK